MSGIEYYPRTPIPTPASATPLGDTSGRDVGFGGSAGSFATIVQKRERPLAPHIYPRKIIGKNTIIIIAIFGHFMVKLCLNNRFNILIDFFCFILV